MSNKKINPFDDIRAVIDGMPPIDTTCGDAVLTRLNSTVGGLKPVGRLDWSVARLANLQRTESPSIKKPMVAVFVGTHQIAESVLGVDLAVAAIERVENVTQGNAAVRGIARSIGAGFKIYEMGVEYPAANMSEEASLSERDCAAAIAFGMEAVAEGADVIVLGSSGLGSATAAAGIARGLYGGAAEYWAGGVGDRASKRIAAVEKSVEIA